MESLLLASFVAGFLTVLAPCLLPLLPVVIGGSLTGTNAGKRNPYIIILSLLLSVIIFSLIIETASTFFYIPQEVWTTIAATLIFFIGLTFLFPTLWTRIPIIRKLSIASNRGIGKGATRSGTIGDVLIGLSLGPAFTSCSPTYLIILAVILPKSFTSGLFYLTAYAVGLGVVLLFIALVGQSAIEKLNIIADEKGWFKKIIGTLMILIALVIYTGYDKALSSYLLDQGFIDTTQLEIEIKQP